MSGNGRITRRTTSRPLTSTRASSLTSTTSSTATTARGRVLRRARRPRSFSDGPDVPSRALVPAGTQTACPYKGVTSGYWSVRTGDKVRDGHQDLAWAYDYPTRQLQPIAGLIAFYNEKLDIDVDGLRLPQARTHFFRERSGLP